MSRFMITATLHKLRARFLKRPWLGFSTVKEHSQMTFCIVILGLGFLYLAQINGLATKGYAINELETRVSNLREGHKQLELRATELRAMTSIEARLAPLQLPVLR